MAEENVEEHLTGAGMAFNLMFFLPVFLTNLVGIFSETFFLENKWFFPALLVVDVIFLLLYYSNFKKRKYRTEAIYYSVLLLLLGAGTVGVIVSYILNNN